MTTKEMRNIELESLSNFIPVILPEAVGFYKQNCMVCFQNQGHNSGIILKFINENSVSYFKLLWSGEVNEQLKRAYCDLKRATDCAACAIALLLIRETTDYTAIEQSCIGTTIDYYLTQQKQDDFLIFNHAARLEVSGILKETKQNTVKKRINDKIRRLKSERNLPTFIVVVEFSTPWSKMVRKWVM